MMKVGILTYHRVVNVGSVVQAWCVVELAKRLFPDAEVEVIDYRPRRMERKEYVKVIKRRPPFLNVRHIKKMRAVRRFVADHLALSATCLVSDDAGKAGEWINTQNYDVILVGSDTVWELRSGAYSPEGVNAFFLPFETAAKKVALATSMDPVPEFTHQQKEVLMKRLEWIERFDYIGVRDEVTRKVLVDGNVPRDSVHFLPDPTIMVDWQNLVGDAPYQGRGDKPVAGVALPRRDALIAHKSLAMAGYEVWDWNGTDSPYCDYVLPAHLGVAEILALYRHLDGFVTDRFHGSIFSMTLSGRPSAFFENPRKWTTPTSKGRSLYRSVGAEGNVFRVHNLLGKPEVLSKMLDNHVNIREKVEHLKSASWSELKCLIEDGPELIEALQNA